MYFNGPIKQSILCNIQTLHRLSIPILAESVSNLVKCWLMCSSDVLIYFWMTKDRPVTIVPWPTSDGTYILEFLFDLNSIYAFCGLFVWLVSVVLCSSVVGLFGPVCLVLNLHALLCNLWWMIATGTKFSSLVLEHSIWIFVLGFDLHHVI